MASSRGVSFGPVLRDRRYAERRELGPCDRGCRGWLEAPSWCRAGSPVRCWLGKLVASKRGIAGCAPDERTRKKQIANGYVEMGSRSCGQERSMIGSGSVEWATIWQGPGRYWSSPRKAKQMWRVVFRPLKGVWSNLGQHVAVGLQSCPKGRVSTLNGSLNAKDCSRLCVKDA